MVPFLSACNIQSVYVRFKNDFFGCVSHILTFIMTRYMFRAEIGEVVARARNGMYSVNVDLIELQSRVVNNITSLEEFPAGMEDSLDEVITDVIADMDLDDDDRIGVSITATDSNGHEYIIHVPLTRVANFNAALIMNTILNVLPSSLSIALTMRLRFSALVTPEAPAIDMKGEVQSLDFFIGLVSVRSVLW